MADTTIPETRYASSDGVNIAFQVLGKGPPDLVFVPSFVSNLELAWDWPPLVSFHRTFASVARLILFDKRGTGLSDRVKELPDTHERMRDLLAVMDATGSERAALAGFSEGAPLAVAFAHVFPGRVTHLILYGPLLCATRTADYPWAEPPEWWDAVADKFSRSWGSPDYMRADVAWRAPSEQSNPDFIRWWGQYRRLGASPGAAADLARMNARIDVRPLLRDLRIPTTVICRAGDLVVSPEHGRYAASAIPGARYVELPGEDHLPFTGDVAPLIQTIAEALGLKPPPPAAPIAPPQPQFDPRHIKRLSARELDIMRWVARGKSNREIAVALYVQEATVRKHLQHVFRKLEVPSRTAALARLNGSLTEDDTQRPSW